MKNRVEKEGEGWLPWSSLLGHSLSIGLLVGDREGLLLHRFFSSSFTY